MTIAIYAGSFDPITNGHLDIIKSASQIFEKVIVVVSYNINKQGFLPVQTRVDLIKQCVKDLPNAEVDSFEGLTVNYAKSKNAKVLIRGLRTSADFDYEIQMLHTNQALNNEIKTVFLSSKPENNYISSSAVREILSYKGDMSKLVPPEINKFLKENY